MVKDIYGNRPNFRITCKEEDTEKVVDILKSIYGFKEIGSHSPYTKDYVQYWYVKNFGQIEGFIFANCINNWNKEDGRKAWVWKTLHKKLDAADFVCDIRTI